MAYEDDNITQVCSKSIIGIDNDERGVIGDFTMMSDIRITKLIVVKSPITPSSQCLFLF